MRDTNQQAIKAFEELKRAFQKVQHIHEINPDFWKHVSFNYPFIAEDDIDSVVDKVEDWVDETIYNAKNNIEA
jgi:hypothetical protein